VEDEITGAETTGDVIGDEAGVLLVGEWGKPTLRRERQGDRGGTDGPRRLVFVVKLGSVSY
jgi:hypothetical protein